MKSKKPTGTVPVRSPRSTGGDHRAPELTCVIFLCFRDPSISLPLRNPLCCDKFPKIFPQKPRPRPAYFKFFSCDFMPAIASTSGRLHSEFIRLLFLQAHRETDRFFADSGVQPAQHTSGGIFTFKREAFLSHLKSKMGSSLAKAAALRVNLNIDGAPITTRSHTHPSHSQTSHLLTSSLVFVFIARFNDS